MMPAPDAAKRRRGWAFLSAPSPVILSSSPESHASNLETHHAQWSVSRAALHTARTTARMSAVSTGPKSACDDGT
jgi:hypothetical protein